MTLFHQRDEELIYERGRAASILVSLETYCRFGRPSFRALPSPFPAHVLTFGSLGFQQMLHLLLDVVTSRLNRFLLGI